MGWFNKTQFKEFDEASTRCGRCAHILPDETLTFCPKCGIPFSKTPPTQSYETLADRAHELILRRYRTRLIALSCLIFVSFWTLLGSFITLQNEALLAEVKEVRPLNVYIKDDPTLPTLSPTAKLASVGHAIEKFKAHFGVEINEVQIFKDMLPPQISQKYPDFLELSERSSLSFWESHIYPSLKFSWKESSTEPLNVLFTNIPIQNDLGQDSPIETAHINSLGLVSGLGHPALSVISSHRLLKEEVLLINTKNTENRDIQLAQFMGEYVFAHELGHALLALPDFISNSHMPSFAQLRGPASNNSIDYANCLMHTDTGGGYAAWKAIQNRQPQSLNKSTSQNCPEYASVIAGFELRNKALKALQEGNRQQAKDYYTEALKVYSPPSKTWLRHQWEQESQLLLSFISRWREQIFMIESKL